MIDMLQNPFVGVPELRKNLTKILAAVRDEGLDLVITAQGKPVALLMDVEKYLELRQASDPEYLASLVEARREIREGRGIPSSEAFAKKGL